MVKKGYNMIQQLKYSTLYTTLSRHLRYGISEKCMTECINKISEIILNNFEINDLISKDDKVLSTAWNKATLILIDIIPHAFIRKKKLQKNRHFIQRSMSKNDIKCVVSIWNKLMTENKEKLVLLIGNKIKKHSEMYIIFQRRSMDIITTINRLSNTDSLIPFLKRIGYKHTQMNIKPQLLASMKKIILDSVKVCQFEKINIIFDSISINHCQHFLQHCRYTILDTLKQLQALTLSWNEEINASWNIAWSFMTYYMRTSFEDALLLNIWYCAHTSNVNTKSQSYIFSLNNNNLSNKIPPFGNEINCLNSINIKIIPFDLLKTVILLGHIQIFIIKIRLK